MSDTRIQPPQPPEIKRRLMLFPYQWIAIPLMMLIPVLALFGVFGESIDSAAASDDTLELDVRYPSRTRYQLPGILEITLTNTSANPLDQVSILIEADYIEQFSNVTFTPSVELVSEEYYEVALISLSPGESRLVTVEVQGDRYGKHDGTITATVNGDGGLDVHISTIIFP